MNCRTDLGEDALQLAQQRVMILASCPSISEEERLLTFEWVRIHFNFRGVKLFAFFADEQPSAKVSSHKNLGQFVRPLHHKNAKDGGDSLGQLDMQLRASTKAIEYINLTRIQRKQLIDESKTKTLHP